MIFDLKDRARRFLFARQHAYRTTFRGPLAERVLRDLAQFCRANETTFHDDPRLHALLEGRREVWLRICRHLDLGADDLLRIYYGKDD